MSEIRAAKARLRRRPGVEELSRLFDAPPFGATGDN